MSAKAVICPACDFIVDTSFLEDFTTEVSLEAVKPPQKLATSDSDDEIDDEIDASASGDGESEATQTGRSGALVDVDVDMDAYDDADDDADDGADVAGDVGADVEAEANGFDDGEGMRTIPALRVQAPTLSGPRSARALTASSGAEPITSVTVLGKRATNPRITADESQIDTAPHRNLVTRASATASQAKRAKPKDAKQTDAKAKDGKAKDGKAKDAQPKDARDTGQVGDEIDTAPQKPPKAPSRPYGGEALILGDVSGLSADFDSMLSDQTSSYTTVGRDLARIFEPTPVYVAPSLRLMIEPSAVLALKEGADPDALQLSSFERTVVALIDGQRPVARIAKKGAIPLDDLKIAIGMLADRQLLVLKGRVRRKNVLADGPRAIGDDEIIDVDDSGDIFIIEEDDAVDDDELRVQHALDPFAHEPGAEAPPVMDLPLGVTPLDSPPTTEPTADVAADVARTREAPSPITLHSRPPTPVAPIAGPVITKTPSAIFARARPSPAPLPAPLPEVARPKQRPLPAPIASPAPAPISAPAPVTVETRVPAALRAPTVPSEVPSAVPSEVPRMPALAPAPFSLPRTTPAPVDVLPEDMPGDDELDLAIDDGAPLPADLPALPGLPAELESPSGALPVAVGTLVGANDLAPDEQEAHVEPPLVGGAESAFGDEVAVRPAATLRPAMPARAARVTVVSAPGATTPGGGTVSLPAQTQQAQQQTQLRRGAASDPAKAEQMIELAFADLRDGRQSRALAYAKMAAKADPQNARAHELLGAWNNPAKLAALAAASSSSNAPASPQSPDQQLVVEAQHAEEARDFAKAADLYKKAIAIKPEEPELRNRLGILFALRLRDYTAATNELMRACELAPDNLAYRSNLGKIFKLANGTPSDATMHTGTDDEKLRAAAKKPTLFDRLRGKKP